MPLGKFSLREIKARPTRALLTFLSIAIGVGAVLAVLLATSTTRMAQYQMLKAISGKSDLEVVADTDAGFSYELVAQVRETTGVATAVPSLTRLAVIFSGDEKARTQVLGIDPRIDQQVREYEVISGRLPTKLNEILLDESFADSLKITVDSPVKILARGGLQDFVVAGLVRPGGTAVALGSAAYLVLPAAQQIFKSGANIDQIQIIVDDEADVDLLLAKLSRELPEGVTVRVPRTSSDMARETIFATENALYMSIAFALLISMFIIYNTFQMAVGERRRQLGILRAIGATRSQISWMILRESLWLSIAGAIAGCLLGVWGAQYLNAATEQMLQVELPGTQLSLIPFIVAVVFGIAVSLLGALLPAKRASQVDPMEAMRAVEVQHNDEVIRRATPLGFILIPVGLIFLWLAISDKLPTGADVVAIICFLLGCVLLVPVLLQPVSNAIVALMRPWLGYEAQLAQKQLMRQVGRSTLTIGVLFIAISTSAGMAGNILDNVENVKNWYSRAIIGDFYVRASMPDLATGAAADLPEGIGEKLATIEGIETLDAMRFVSAQSGEHSILIVVREFVGNPNNFFDLEEGTPAETQQGLSAGKVVIGTVLAKRLDVHVGDQIPLETQQGTEQLEIVATTNDYLGGGLTVYLERKYAAQMLGVQGVDAYVIGANKDQMKEVETKLREFCQKHNLIFQSYAELVQFIDSMINGVIASLWMLLILGCVIAAMGLVNTLTMNILEQTREIGMLRVVAMTRNQVRRMIFAQATLLGLIGLLPGALAGVFVAYAISLSAFSVLGHNIQFQFRPGLVFGCLGCGLLVVLVASLIPAERAARLKLASALHYE